MSRKKRKRGRGRVLILVVLLALIVFGVFARGVFTSGRTTAERAQRELHTYAEQHETSLADYPDALVQLYARNPDARDFVRDYPKKKDLTPTIDLSNLSGSKTVPLLLQWDERWGYREYNESIIGLAGCGPTCLSMATIYPYRRHDEGSALDVPVCRAESVQRPRQRQQVGAHLRGRADARP